MSANLDENHSAVRLYGGVVLGAAARRAEGARQQITTQI